MHNNISPEIFFCYYAHIPTNLIVYIGRKHVVNPVAQKLIKITLLKEIQKLIVEYIIKQFLLKRSEMKRYTVENVINST